MKKKSFLLIFLMLLVLLSLGAEDYYDNGSQTFSITVGADLPFTNSYKLSDGSWTTGYWWGEDGTHFNIGGYGSIDYEVFVTSKISLGGEIGYQFNRCTDSHLFTQVPLLFRVTYVPLQGKFETPISFGAGLNYISYNSKSMLCMSFALNAGIRYFFTDSWAVGIKTGMEFTPELYFNTEKLGLHTSIPAQLFVTYRH